MAVTDAALAGSILVVPFLMGGRHPIGQLALVVLAATAMVAWALRQAATSESTWRPTYAALLLLAGVILVVFQLAPLSPAWLAKCSPRAIQLLPMWSLDAEPAARLGTWSQISLVPEETRAGLILLASYSLLFLVTVQRVGRAEDVERILRWCAVAAVAMAGFGLVQYFTSNGKFFWFHEAPYSSTDDWVKGAFTNRNHFAHFLALGIGPLVWWLYRVSAPGDERRSFHLHRDPAANVRRLLFIGATVGVVFASLLSLSRGGNTALLLAAVIAAVICGRAAAVRGRFLLGIVAVGVLVLVALNVFGFQRVSDRLSDLSSGSLARLDNAAGRRKVWKAVADAIPDFALFGSGVGSHREVCPVYLKDPPDGIVYTNAENGPLQESLETGLVGATLLAGGIGLCAFWCVAGLRRGQSPRLQACLGAIAASLTASLAHSMVDFVWYVPGCTAVVAILAALACRAWQLGRPPERAAATWHLPRAAALAVAVGVILVSVDMVGNRFRATVAQHYWDCTCLVAAERTPAEQDLSVPENRRREIDTEKRLLADLEQVVRWYPEHASAHLALARCHLRLFDLFQMSAPNPMPLPQIRDAALASAAQFPSLRARDEWMQRAFGDHCDHLYHALDHTRIALRRCPLQGRGYLYLAELSFLDGPRGVSKQACLDQALRVRPASGDVLDMAARETYEALLAGDLESWLKLARRTVHSQKSVKKRLIENLVASTPPPGIEAVVEFIVTQLQPDLEGLTFLYRATKGRASAKQLEPLRRYYASVAESEANKNEGRKAAGLWMLAAGARADLGDRAGAIRCTQNAHATDPGDLRVRYRLACLLLDSGNGQEAQSHLLHCVRREPENQQFQQKYKETLAWLGKQKGQTASRQPTTTR